MTDQERLAARREAVRRRVAMEGALESALAHAQAAEAAIMAFKRTAGGDKRTAGDYEHQGRLSGASRQVRDAARCLRRARAEVKPPEAGR